MNINLGPINIDLGPVHAGTGPYELCWSECTSDIELRKILRSVLELGKYLKKFLNS